MTDDAIEQYYQLEPVRFHSFLRLDIKRDPFGDAVNIVLDIGSNDTNVTESIRLTFGEVTSFSYIPGFWSFGFIEVIRVEGKWQEPYYRVFETEQDSEFKLMCQRFEACIVSN